MSPRAATNVPTWLLRPWRMLRKDIGRKFTALVCALLLWTVLENLVVADRDLVLEVRKVSTREEADRQRATASAIYLVVPSDLILRPLPRSEFTLHVKGIKDDVANLNLSAVVAFDSSMLGTDDERVFPVALERDVFKNVGDHPPQLTSFRVTPSDGLKVSLARSATAEITLTPNNVVPVGKPLDGFSFQESRTTLRPNVVTVTGPRAAIETLRKDPLQPRLTPVNIEGRSATVTQNVGLPRELLDAGVALQTTNGTVEVSIFLEADMRTMSVVSVPVIYRNEDALKARRVSIKKTTETIDLKIRGPQPELDKYTADQLRQCIVVKFDWRDAPPNVLLARPRVQVFTSGLSDEVHVEDDATGAEPEISYQLEPMPESP